MLSEQEIVQLATDLLLAGVDTKTLAVLAGSERSYWSGRKPLITAVFNELTELNLFPSTEQLAVKTLVDITLQRIVDNELAPEEGADQLDKFLTFELGISVDERQRKPLKTFHQLWYGWETRSSTGREPEQIRSEIVNAAKRLLAMGGLSAE